MLIMSDVNAMMLVPVTVTAEETRGYMCICWLWAMLMQEVGGIVPVVYHIYVYVCIFWYTYVCKQGHMITNEIPLCVWIWTQHYNLVWNEHLCNTFLNNSF